jgi:N-acetylated-alpha-linked acidic dipeptidase
VSTLRRDTEEIDRQPSRAPKPDLTAVRNQLARLQTAAVDLDAAYARALPNLGSAPPEKLAALNRILFHTERSLALDPGLPGRPWYRHLIYAPGVYTGYAAKTLPGIREAVEAGKADEAREQAARVVQVLGALNDQIVQATSLLSQL